MQLTRGQLTRGSQQLKPPSSSFQVVVLGRLRRLAGLNLETLNTSLSGINHI